MVYLRNFRAFKNSKGIKMLSIIVQATACLLNILPEKESLS